MERGISLDLITYFSVVIEDMTSKENGHAVMQMRGGAVERKEQKLL